MINKIKRTLLSFGHLPLYGEKPCGWFSPPHRGGGAGEEGLLLFLFLFLLFSCQKDASVEPVQRTHVLEVPVNIDIPMSELQTTRAMGDPGTYEHFDAPCYVYSYFVVDIPGDETMVCYPLRSNHVDTYINPLDLSLYPHLWTKEIHNYDDPQTKGDSVYRFPYGFYYKIPDNASRGRLYMIASKVLLPGMPTVNFWDGEGDRPANNRESDVLAQTFDVSTDAVRDNLQNIYTTPYNYQYKGKYYGTVNDVSSNSTERLNLMLYHVAAKVDLMWNVAKEKQSTQWLSYIQARKLKKLSCKLFKPTENTWTSADDADNYSLDLFDGDIAQQWYGRAYFYTIPYKKDNYFDISLHVLKNGDDKTANAASGYNLTLRKNMSSTNAVFVPWLRGDLNFTSTMEYKDETKTVN